MKMATEQSWLNWLKWQNWWGKRQSQKRS